MSIIEKGRTKTAVSGSEVGDIEALVVLLKDQGHAKLPNHLFTWRFLLKHTIFYAEFSVSTKEKGKTKTAVSGSEVVAMKAQLVFSKIIHGHSEATESRFTRRSY